MGREALRRSLWALDGRAERTELAEKILDRFGWDPARVVNFAARATSAKYAEFAPLVLECASLGDPLEVTLVEEAAEAAARIITRLMDMDAPAITLIGGLAKPLAPWLGADVSRCLCNPKSDPLAGAILMARQAFFDVASLRCLAS